MRTKNIDRVATNGISANASVPIILKEAADRQAKHRRTGAPRQDR
jgi:hypothetical protein